MDLMTVANQLKNLSDEQLAQASVGAPPYLVLAEMKRREQTRAEYQAAMSRQPNGKTVAQEAFKRFSRPQQPPMMPGLPPQQPPQGIAAAAGMPPQRMAGGGLASIGAQVARMMQGRTAPFLPATTGEEYDTRYPTTDIRSIIEQVRGMRGADPMAKVEGELEAASAKYGNRKPSMWETLAQFGFGMAAAPTHSFGMAVGQGGLGAIQNMQQRRMLDEKAHLDTLRERAQIGAARQAAQDRDMAAATDVYRSSEARQNTKANVIESARRDAAEREAMAPVRSAQVKAYEAQANVRDAIAEQRQIDQTMAKALKENPEQVLEQFGVKPTPQLIESLKNGTDEFRLSMVKRLTAAWAHKAQSGNMTDPEIIWRAAGGDPQAQKAFDMMLRRTAAGRATPDRDSPLGGGLQSPVNVDSIVGQFGGRPLGGK